MFQRLSLHAVAYTAVLGAVLFGCSTPVEQATASEPEAAVQVNSLRGPIDLAHADPVPERLRMEKYDEPLARSFEQQPPLSVHGSAYDEINLTENRCLECHDKPYYKAEEAPKISDTHYMGPDGKEMDTIAKNRWFCTQCHVPQSDIDPLVGNTFQPVAQK